MSPTLFNIYVANIERFFREGQDGEIVAGNRRIWTLSYADDTVLLVSKESEMKKMMKRGERYLRGKS